MFFFSRLSMHMAYQVKLLFIKVSHIHALNVQYIFTFENINFWRNLLSIDDKLILLCVYSIQKMEDLECNLL